MKTENSRHPLHPLHILYVLPYVPSPIRVRPFQFIRNLTSLGHVVTVVALEDGLASASARAELKAMCAAVHIVPLPRITSVLNVLLSLPTPTPMWAAWCRSQTMERLLSQLANPADFDVAHVEHLRAAHFAGSLGGLPAVIDAVDCITDLRRQMAAQPEGEALNRIISGFEWRKLRKYEPRVYRKYRRIAISSEHDARTLAALDADLPPVDVVANGVDLEYFRPTPQKPDENCLVFSGKMSYSANDDAARYLISAILPRIRSSRQNTRLTVVGTGASKALIRAAANAGDIQITGFVDDIRPHIRQASVSVSPMRVAVGVQNKVLEAMALGRPVVCSSLAARALNKSAMACEGDQDDFPRPVIVADDPDQFAQSCVQLLDRPAEAALRGCAARRYVENYHSWNATTKRLAEVYHTVTSNG